jgi:16S rRNA (cytosine1402-N4)-methyltransferase
VVKNGREVLSNIISSQIALHTLYGGVVPEIASRKHIEKIYQVIEEALNTIPEKVFPEKNRKEAVKKSCQRSFQALRIDVNSEFEVLYAFLDKLPEVLAPNGRVAILTFHSGEDRLVKHSFKEFEKMGLYSEVSKDVIRPSQEECIRNGRAKCTKMRWAIRAEE